MLASPVPPGSTFPEYPCRWPDPGRTWPPWSPHPGPSPALRPGWSRRGRRGLVAAGATRPPAVIGCGAPAPSGTVLLKGRGGLKRSEEAGDKVTRRGKWGSCGTSYQRGLTACVLPGQSGVSCRQQSGLWADRHWRPMHCPAPDPQDYKRTQINAFKILTIHYKC